MANNRIYLRCKGCGEVQFLGKMFGTGYYYDDYGGAPLVEKLNKFYDDHTFCSRDKLQPSERGYDHKLFPLPDDCGGCAGAYDIVYDNGEGTGIDDDE